MHTPKRLTFSEKMFARFFPMTFWRNSRRDGQAAAAAWWSIAENDYDSAAEKAAELMQAFDTALNLAGAAASSRRYTLDDDYANSYYLGYCNYLLPIAQKYHRQALGLF